MDRLTNIQKLEESVARLRDERQFKRDIINALHDAILVFDRDLNIQIINEEARQLLSFKEDTDDFFEDLAFFKNKKRTLKFHIKTWLQDTLDKPHSNPKETHVWVTLKHTDTLFTPVLISSKTILSKRGEFQGLLLAIYDRSIYAQADEQNRILEAAFNSYDGQFITNEKGYIIKPNFAFSAYTGLMPQEFSELSIIQWIKKQVTLKGTTQIDDILKTLLTEKKWSGEVKICPSEDTVFHTVLSLSMISDNENNVEHYIGTLQDITDIKEAQAEIEHLAYFDDLTGLPNRRLMVEHLEHAVLHNKRDHSYSALLYIDLDNFKEINDIYGHTIGDRTLKYTAETLLNHLRAVDILGRISGDEFLVLTRSPVLSSATAVQHALTLSTKLQKVLSQNILLDDLAIPSAASIGVCVFPMADTDLPDALISNADLAMYEAKKRGRNQTYFYKSELTQKILKRRELEEALKNANYDDEFYLAYQPQASDCDETLHAEALIRWNQPQLGVIPPDRFIHVAEDNKQILKLGLWIIETAFKQAKKWNDAHPKNIHLSINISPVQFHERDFVETVQNIQAQTQIDPNWITLELTEGILIKNIDDALIKIKQLAALGYKLSIDDFGTGYSSLSYFQKLPIHELKIDQSFVSRLPGSREDSSIVNTIIQLASSKDLTVVAEGVETLEQVEFLKKQNGNILLQGYYFSKPLTAQHFEETFLIQT